MKTAVRVLGSLTLLAVLFWRVDTGRVAAALAEVRWGWWLLAVATYGFAQLVSAVRWQGLARPLGFDEPLGRFSNLYFVGTFFNMLLPTSVGGDVVRAWYLDAGRGRRWAALLTVLADRLSGLVVLMLLAFFGSLFVELPGWVRGWAVAAGGLAAFGVILFFLIPRPRREATGGLAGKVLQLAAAACEYRRSPRLLAAATLLAVVVQVANVVLVCFLARALGLTVGDVHFFVVVPLVTLLTLAPVSVNGMGVREGGMALLLAPLGVPGEEAVTLALLWFSVFLTAGLAGAGCYFFGRFPRYEARSDDEPVSGHPDQGRARQPRAAA